MMEIINLLPANVIIDNYDIIARFGMEDKEV